MSLFKRCWIRTRRLCGHTFQLLGATWIAILLLRVFLEDRLWYNGVERWTVAAMLLVSVVYGVRKSRPVRAVICKEAQSDLQIEIKIGDIFAEKGSLVVGTNTTFDTRMDDGTISPTSIQGRYTARYFSAGLQDLDRQLEETLKAVQAVGERTTEQKPFGKRRVYPLGTVVPVHAGERKAYFCAMAHFNAKKRAQVGAAEFLDALPHLWNGIRDYGGMEDLLCPLLGARHGRIPAKRLELLGEIVRSFLAANRGDTKIADNFTVVIAPEDQKQGQIDMEDVGRWLEHECSTNFMLTDGTGAPGREIT